MSNNTNSLTPQTAGGGNNGSSSGGSSNTTTTTGIGNGGGSATSNTAGSQSRRNKNRHKNTNQPYGSNMPKSFVPKINSIEPIGTASENGNLDFYKVQKSIHHYVITNFTDPKHLSKSIMQYKDPHDSLNDDKKKLKEMRSEEGCDLIMAPGKNEPEEDKAERELENQD